MNGIHDIGGMHGIGSIEPEENGPVFRAEWERRVFAMFIATSVGGQFSSDECRFAIERMAPAHYLDSSYYEHWMHAIETLLTENGSITRDELDAKIKELS